MDSSLNHSEIQQLASAVYRNDYNAVFDYIHGQHKKLNTDAVFSLHIPEAQSLQILIPKDQLKLIHIAAAGDALEVYTLLEQNGFSTNDNSAASYLPIHYACICDSFEVATYILTKDPQMATVEPRVEFHLLYLTATSGNAQIMKLLFDNGVNYKSTVNKSNNPIRKAVETKNVECLKCLLTHCRQTTGSNQYSLAMLAAINQEPLAVELALQFDPCPITYCCPIDHKSLLDICCFCSSQFKSTIIKILGLVDDIEPPYSKCQGPAQWICIAFDLDIAKAFFKHHIDVNRIDGEGKTGFHYFNDKSTKAANYDSLIIQIMTMFLDHGFDINIQTQTKTPVSNSILEYFVSSITKSYRIISFLIDNGANIMALNKDGIPLYDAIMKKRNSALKEIFQKAHDNPKFKYEVPATNDNSFSFPLNN